MTRCNNNSNIPADTQPATSDASYQPNAEHDPSSAELACWHLDFTARYIPAVVSRAGISFRRFNPDARAELTQAAITLAWRAYSLLRKSGRDDRLFPTVLARYSCAQAKSGRSIGNKLNTRDVLSPTCQQRHSFAVARFGSVNDLPEQCHEALSDHRQAPIPDHVAFRIDFPEWLRSLSRRAKEIACDLAVGHTTSEVAAKFGVTAARISQLRRELAESWSIFRDLPETDLA